MTRFEIAGLAFGVAAAIGGIGLLAHRAATQPEPMEASEFARIVRQLASDARESAHLAALVADGRVNEHYARAAHEKLGDDVKDTRKRLEAPPPRGGEEATRKAGELAQHMKDLLDTVPRVMADRDAMQRLQAEHDRIAGDLDRLAPR